MAFRSRMISLRIPSRGPHSAHKTPFLQLSTYGLSSTYGCSAPTLKSPHPPLQFHRPPFFSLEWRQVRYIAHRTRPKGHLQVSYKQMLLLGGIPQIKHYQEEKKDFPTAKRMKKDRAEERQQRKRQKEEQLPGNMVRFGATCSVHMTSCTFFDYLPSAGSWETEAWVEKRKTEWKLRLCLVWKQLERGDVIVWYNSILNEM